jgi:hypothetical protein
MVEGINQLSNGTLLSNLAIIRDNREDSTLAFPAIGKSMNFFGVGISLEQPLLSSSLSPVLH